MQSYSPFSVHTNDLWRFYVDSAISGLDGGPTSTFVAWTDDGHTARPVRRLELGIIDMRYTQGSSFHDERIGDGIIADNLLQGRWLTGFDDTLVPIDAMQGFLGDLDEQLHALGMKPLNGLFGSYLPLPMAFGIKAACQSVDSPPYIHVRVAQWSDWWLQRMKSNTPPTPANSNVASLDTGIDRPMIRSLDHLLGHINFAQSLMAELSNHLTMGYEEAARIKDNAANVKDARRESAGP